MKALSLALLLMASVAFVMLGCSDNSNSLVMPSEQPITSPSGPTALGKATAVTTSEVISYDAVFTAVELPCAGEDIQLHGEVHLVTHVTTQDNGDNLFTVHGNPRGVYGVGLTSGTIYKAVGESHVVDHIKAGENFSWVNNFLFISNGSAPNLLMKDYMHLKINDNGEVTYYVERHTVECK